MKKSWVALFVGILFVSYAMFTVSKSVNLAKLDKDLRALKDEEAELHEKHQKLVTKNISGTEELTRTINDVLYRIERVQKRIKAIEYKLQKTKKLK